MRDFSTRRLDGTGPGSHSTDNHQHFVHTIAMPKGIGPLDPPDMPTLTPMHASSPPPNVVCVRGFRAHDPVRNGLAHMAGH